MQYEPEVLRRLQLVLLDMLKDIDAVCRENGIEYFLDAGTCLGAIRHGGFIPWDDDVDLGMRRADYERFLEIAPAALGEGYVVAHPRSDKRVAGMFAKVWKKGTVFSTRETIEAGLPQGIFIDVFPYDGVHADERAARKQLRACRMWQNVSYLYHSKAITVPHRGFLGKVERAACSVAHGAVRAALSPERIAASFEKAAASGGPESGDMCADMAYTQFGRFPVETLFPTRLHRFEDAELPVPGDPERYLEIAYGPDWRELPPKERRRNHAPLVLDFGD